MSYYLAPSLVDLRNEINAAYPDRDKASDGWIGDPSHQARVSDHNPDYADGGVVRAIDVDKDGIDVNKLISVLKGDSRVNYFIFNGKIYGASKFAARTYKGSNKHTKHIHISIKHSKSAESAGAWGYSSGAIKPVANKPKPVASNRPTDYKDLAVDGKFGKSTITALQILMSQIDMYHRAIDGVAGKHTWIAVQSWLWDLGYYKRAVDGSFGKHSVIALQKFLAKKGHLDTRKWLIDGKFGKETIKAFQKYLNQQNGK